MADDTGKLLATLGIADTNLFENLALRSISELLCEMRAPPFARVRDFGVHFRECTELETSKQLRWPAHTNS